MKRAALYARVSGDVQAKEACSRRRCGIAGWGGYWEVINCRS